MEWAAESLVYLLGGGVVAGMLLAALTLGRGIRPREEMGVDEEFTPSPATTSENGRSRAVEPIHHRKSRVFKENAK